jgi:hypothetical protein
LGGYDKVAEVCKLLVENRFVHLQWILQITGRQHRQVKNRIPGSDDEYMVIRPQINVEKGLWEGMFFFQFSLMHFILERNDVQNGIKFAAVFSQKGSTGISLHSVPTNPSRRVQVMLEYPWGKIYCVWKDIEN